MIVLMISFWDTMIPYSWIIRLASRLSYSFEATRTKFQGQNYLLFAGTDHVSMRSVTSTLSTTPPPPPHTHTHTHTYTHTHTHTHTHTRTHTHTHTHTNTHKHTHKHKRTQTPPPPLYIFPTSKSEMRLLYSLLSMFSCSLLSFSKLDNQLFCSSRCVFTYRRKKHSRNEIQCFFCINM